MGRKKLTARLCVRPELNCSSQLRGVTGGLPMADNDHEKLHDEMLKLRIEQCHRFRLLPAQFMRQLRSDSAFLGTAVDSALSTQRALRKWGFQSFHTCRTSRSISGH